MVIKSVVDIHSIAERKYILNVHMNVQCDKNDSAKNILCIHKRPFHCCMKKWSVQNIIIANECYMK